MQVSGIKADVTTIEMDAIVNKANESLLDGGVDGTALIMDLLVYSGATFELEKSPKVVRTNVAKCDYHSPPYLCF